MTCYGACELKQKLQKFALTGLTLAAILYSLGLSVYWYSVSLEHTFIKRKRIEFSGPFVLGQLPSIGGVPINQIGVRVADLSNLLEDGTPIPVPEAQINPEKSYPRGEDRGAEGLISGGIGGGIKEDWDGFELNPDNQPPPPFKPVEKQPIIIKQVNPIYPEIARRAGIEGKVWAKVWIDQEGKIRQVVIIKSNSDLFDKPVLEAVNQWIFTPAVMNNGPVAVWVSLPFVFKLN